MIVFFLAVACLVLFAGLVGLVRGVAEWAWIYNRRRAGIVTGAGAAAVLALSAVAAVLGGHSESVSATALTPGAPGTTEPRARAAETPESSAPTPDASSSSSPGPDPESLDSDDWAAGRGPASSSGASTSERSGAYESAYEDTPFVPAGGPSVTRTPTAPAYPRPTIPSGLDKPSTGPGRVDSPGSGTSGPGRTSPAPTRSTGPTSPTRTRPPSPPAQPPRTSSPRTSPSRTSQPRTSQPRTSPSRTSPRGSAPASPRPSMSAKPTGGGAGTGSGRDQGRDQGRGQGGDQDGGDHGGGSRERPSNGGSRTHPSDTSGDHGTYHPRNSPGSSGRSGGRDGGRPAATARPSSRMSGCSPSYPDVCLHPDSGDYDCQGTGNGPNAVAGPIRVSSPDPFALDPDRDGIGCV